MGQYYMPTLIAGDGTVSTLHSHQYDNGLKLMEHSDIDLAEYIRQNKWTTAGSWNNGVFDPNDTWEMCINPLPLLTACGNGRGGGDYHDCYPDYDKVGAWAFDLIEGTDVRPGGYAQYELCFTEQREAAQGRS